MNRILILILCLGAWSLRADLLDETSSLLDIIEKDYWLSQRSPEGEYRIHTEEKLQKLVNNINTIQRKLMVERKGGVADITSPAMTLRSNYGVFKPSTIKRFTLRFQTTSMRNYSREFKKVWKEKAAQQAEGGDKKDKNKRKVAAAPNPRLDNVDLVEYERWLAEVFSANAEKLQNAKSNGSRSEVEKVNNAVSSYFTAVRQLRFGLAKIRQNTKIQFK